MAQLRSGIVDITQDKVARKLGISRGTLHRVLIGSPLVKPSTRTRVERALAELGYTPNMVAQSLRTGRTKTIGLISQGDAKTAEVEKTRAIHDVARLHGYSVFISYSDGTAESEARCIEELRSRMVDGLILKNNGFFQDTEHLHRLTKSKIGLVSLLEIPGAQLDCVFMDVRWAYFQLTDYLIKAGHRRIALLIEDLESAYGGNRTHGYQEAMEAAGLPHAPEWIVRASVRLSEDDRPTVNGVKVRTLSDYRLGFRGAQKLFELKPRPTAVVCQSDQTAIGLLHAAKLAGIRVPEDLSITGYDDIPAAEYARVPLTTMHQPEEELGFEAVGLLLRRLGGDWTGFPKSVSIKPKLIVRESCVPPGAG